MPPMEVLLDSVDIHNGVRISCPATLIIPGESKKVSAFGGLWNKKYVTDIKNTTKHSLSLKT